MPELERLILIALAEVGETVREAYDTYDYKRIVAVLSNFMNIELSAFYFDIRKDALYCDPISSIKRRASLTVLDAVFDCLTAWLAPILVFTMEEAGWSVIRAPASPCTCGCSPTCRPSGATTG